MSTAEMKAAMTEVGKAAKDFDDAGSAPLIKNAAVESQYLEELREQGKLLPQDWMPLACIRTRKYDKERAKNLMENFSEIMKDINSTPLTVESQKEHIQRGVLRVLPCRDKQGRIVINARLRFHDPKKYPTQLMIRTIMLTILNAMQGAPFEGESRRQEEMEKTQLNGFVMLNDMTNISFSNMDPGVPKKLLPMLSGKMPARLAGIYILNPPFFFSYVMFPLLKLFISKKLKERMHILSDKKQLLEFFDASELPEEYGGLKKIPDDYLDTLVNRVYKDMT